MQLDIDTREQQWLSWLIVNKQTTEEIVQASYHFIADAGESPPLAHWIATYGTVAGYEAILKAISDYINPPSLPPMVIPPPPIREGQQLVVSSHRDELLDALIRQQFGVTKKRAGVLSTIAFWLVVAFVIVTLAVLINQGIRLVANRDVPNEVRILLASRQIPNFQLDDNGEFLAWSAGSIVFYSHDYACVPAFKAFSAQGGRLPPPSEWPEKDVDQLLKSEYYGCAPQSLYRQWAGYWGDTPWAALGTYDQAWLIAHGISTKDKPQDDGFLMWVEYPRMKVTKKDFLILGSKDLKEQGAIGQTEIATPEPTATLVPTQVRALDPTQEPAANPPAQPQAPEQPAPAVDTTEQTAVPTVAPTEMIVIATPVPPFATQTAIPTQRATVTPITPSRKTLVPVVSMPTPRQVMQQSRYTANDGSAYSDACVVLADKYEGKTDNAAIPIPDFVGLTNCSLHGKTN